ncbi:MAG: EAL domain-containing protein [Rhodospirillales bacterium]|nr:EAL domain-containing protein [Rhodospirillales bacterium]
MAGSALSAIAARTTLAAIALALLASPGLYALVRGAGHRTSAAEGMLLVAVILGLALLIWGELRLVPSRALNHFIAAAHDQATRFETALDNLTQGVCFFDGAQRLLMANRRYAEIYDLPADLVVPGTTLGAIITYRHQHGTSPGMAPGAYLAWRRRLSLTNQPSDTEVTTAAGRIITIHHRPTLDGGWVSTHEDVTERRRAQARIAHLACHDMLTGLPNGAQLRQHLNEVTTNAVAGRMSALLILDLDRFKSVNDSLGHLVGDALLRAVADRLRAAVREQDLVARLGGDEFAILQTDIDDEAKATALARRIIDIIAAPFDLAGQQLSIGTSIGIVLCPRHGTRPEEVLSNAGMALYDVKTQDRGRFQLFCPAMEERLHLRRSIEADLATALVARQFVLFFQPVVSAATGNVITFEALVRWQHPEHGLIPPDMFIPVAEATGVIVPLGEWILHAACAEAARWPSPIRVAVNLSAVQVANGQLVEVVSGALRATGLAPHRLELEITETMVLADTEAVHLTLAALRELGVHISLDDFGTGYSSLSYLRKLPFDRIKIDRSFIRDLGEERESTAIVGAIVGLARTLGLTVTAEGVETEDQSRILTELGCTDMQGYHFGRPEPNPQPARPRQIFVSAA